MDFDEIVRALCQKDRRYTPQAYHLVRLALDYSQKKVHGEEKKSKDATESPNRHVTGEDLLDGFREYVLNTYGPMSYHLLQNWGLKKSVDVGHIVFKLIEVGLFGKSEEDDLSDFENLYDFKEAFLRPFEPSSKVKNS
ncbi:hypothetical protein EBR11_01675 [bacterium]|jgi:uncharacterized repeat protein (TIGR04138 family)|nr:hypothetical protein [bacterium]